jgi:hypothetical protein
MYEAARAERGGSALKSSCVWFIDWNQIQVEWTAKSFLLPRLPSKPILIPWHQNFDRAKSGKKKVNTRTLYHMMYYILMAVQIWWFDRLCTTSHTNIPGFHHIFCSYIQCIACGSNFYGFLYVRPNPTCAIYQLVGAHPMQLMWT